VYVPYVKGDSEKFKCIGNWYNIRMIFRTKHTLRSSLMRERDPQQMSQCVYSIPWECGRSYIGETDRPLAVQLREYRHNFKEGLLEKFKLAHHVYEEGHRVIWNEARKLKATVSIGSTRNWPIGVLNKSYQRSQFGYLSNLDPPYQLWGDEIKEITMTS
jgi:hypothetical protein